LDRYGSWDRVDGYDWVWSPAVDPYWAPYRSGRWIWGGYWGWTWSSYEPWGWAPYHYGRWFSHHNRWCWWPGPVTDHYRPMWAPAYVSFLGFGYGGRNWSFGSGFGFNSLGWVPTGPGDYYHPWWGDRNSYNVVNVTNITNIRNVYNINSGHAVGPLANSRRYPRISNVENVMTDSHLQRGITTTSTEDFARGRGHTRYQPATGMDLKNAQLVAGTPPVVPTQESLKASDQPARITTALARANAGERYFTRNQPQAQTVSFQSQAAGMQQMVQTSNPLNAPGRAEISDRARVRQGGGAPAGGSAEALNAQPASRTATPSSSSPANERGRFDRSGNGAGMVTSGNRGAAPGAQSAPATPGSSNGRSSGSRIGVDRAGDPSSVPAAGSQPAAQTAPVPSSEGNGRSGWTPFGNGRSTSPPVAEPSAAPAMGGSDSRRVESASPASNDRNRLDRNSRNQGSIQPSAPVSTPAQTRPERSPAVENDRGGWRRFSNSDRPEAAAPVSPAPSGTSPAESRRWESFPSNRDSGVESRIPSAPSPSTTERPQRFERTVPNDQPARVYSTPSNSDRERGGRFSSPDSSSSAPRQETRPAPRSEAPVYQERSRSYESPRVERPPLRIERPVVTERSAPRGHDGGPRVERQAPSSPPPQSSDRGGRGQYRR
jgi:hypothetical protein